jgi:hypothetical protein
MWWQLDSGCALLVGTPEPLRIDYQKLKAHMNEPRVARDMGLSRVRGVDHFLSFFVFDEPAFTEFVRDVRATTDDRTVIDFSAPRWAGSGFGLGQYTAQVITAEGSSFKIISERQKYYVDRRRSVVPYLFNLGGETLEAVGERIKALTGMPAVPRPLTESEWRAMRSNGHCAAGVKKREVSMRRWAARCLSSGCSPGWRARSGSRPGRWSRCRSAPGRTGSG